MPAVQSSSPFRFTDVDLTGRRKTIYTLAVDNYAPEITAITFPLIKHWADKIGARTFVIDERRYPEWPPAYEKLQLFDLARESNDEWSIFIDADALVHPDCFDPTELIGKDTVLHNGSDFAPARWSYDEYFRRDGRHIGSCNWLAIASEWCRDLWHPVEGMTPDEVAARIHPIVNELSNGVDAHHLIDDYVVSRNIARYGLKFTTMDALMTRHGMAGKSFFMHQYIPRLEAGATKLEQKVKDLQRVLALWKVDLHPTAEAAPT